MARSIDTIYSIIIAQKETTAELSGLTSSSSTAIWRLWAHITAAVIYTLEVLYDTFRSEITTLLETLKPGTLLWYQAMCKAFQYGDALTWNNGYSYAEIDEASQIIDQCSVTEGNGGLVIKIATDVSGELQQLSEAQEDAFAEYVAQMKYAGTRVSIVNSAANKLHVAAQVYYDPLVIKADGTDIDEATKPVELAIQSFLRELPFNGRLKRNAVINAMLSVPGVSDVKILTLAHKYGAGAYDNIDVSVIPESGYFKIDAAYPLSSSLTYIAAQNNV